MPSTFGVVLKQLRGELGLSQSDLAQSLSSTQRHVSFLETGRSQPSRNMLGRLVEELNLNAAQRATLFDASGFRNPYKSRTFTSAEVAEALDMIENQVLAHWPFPAFVLNKEWTVIRMNKSARKMFGPLEEALGGTLNLFALFLSEQFRSQIENWEEASASVYFRLQAAAAHSPALRKGFEKARADGVFANVGKTITESDDVPIYVPIIMHIPGGPRLRLTSLLGKLVSVHDALVEGFEIEFMVPTDNQSQELLTQMLE